MKHSLTALALLVPTLTLAAGVKEPMYGQVMFGELKLNENNVRFTANDEVYEGELPDSIPYLGAAAQVIWKDDVIGYGWEGGGFFSWFNRSTSYYASSGGGGTTIRINIDNSFWAIETFMGLYGSFKPMEALRFYVGAGPLFLFATTKVDDAEPEEPQPLSGSSIAIDVDDYHSDFTIGAYARAGFEFRLPNNYWLGASVRHMQADLDLGNTLGDFDIDGEVYYMTVTKKL